MMHPFIMLAYGLCAFITKEGGTDLVALGYTSGGACVSHLSLGASSGPEDTVTVGDHAVAVEPLDGGFVVHVDDLQFVLQGTVDL